MVSKRDDLESLRTVLTRRLSRRRHPDRISSRILAHKEDNTLEDPPDPLQDAHRISVAHSKHRRELATCCKMDSVQYFWEGGNEITSLCGTLFYNRGITSRSCVEYNIVANFDFIGNNKRGKCGTAKLTAVIQSCDSSIG